MSRRTKLIIIGILLVLLGIVAVYAASLWRVKDPLRFRVVGVSHPVRGNPPYPDWRLIRYEIEAKNVSSVPISIKRVFIYPASVDEVWFEYKGRKISRSTGLREGIEVGGHKTERMAFFFYTGVTEDEEANPWDVTYLWEVPLLHRVNSWLRANAPAPVRFHIQPHDASYGTAALEFAPDYHLRAAPADHPKP
jgi:hypothetical protein